MKRGNKKTRKKIYKCNKRYGTKDIFTLFDGCVKIPRWHISRTEEKHENHRMARHKYKCFATRWVLHLRITENFWKLFFMNFRLKMCCAIFSFASRHISSTNFCLIPWRHKWILCFFFVFNLACRYEALLGCFFCPRSKLKGKFKANNNNNVNSQC